MDDALSTRVAAALADADTAELARTDQLASLWREFYSTRGLDLAEPAVADSSLRALTMVYGLLMASRAAGDLDESCWAVVTDVLASGAAAVTVAKGAPPRQPDVLL